MAEKGEQTIRVKKAWGPDLTEKCSAKTRTYNRLNLNGEPETNYMIKITALYCLIAKKKRGWPPKIASPWRLHRKKDKSNV